MPLSSIVIIVLRLFSLNWLLHAIYTLSFAFQDSDRYRYPTGYLQFLPPGVMLAAAFGLLYWAKTLARVMSPRPDPTISLGGITQYDLYCFAFTFLGLYFVLSSFADTLNSLHYTFTVMRDTHEGNPQRPDAFYELTRPLITLVFGCLSMLFSSRCAKKLTEIQRKNEVA